MSPLCTELPVYSGKLSKNKKEAVGLATRQKRMQVKYFGLKDGRRDIFADKIRSCSLTCTVKMGLSRMKQSRLKKCKLFPHFFTSTLPTPMWKISGKIG